MNQINPLRFSGADYLSVIHRQTSPAENQQLAEALRKSNERIYYAGKITTDAIWDLDLETNEIYRSEAFAIFSGYDNSLIEPSLDWWYDRIHPDDMDRVRMKVNDSIMQGVTYWQDEYRFKCADGTYKFLLD